MSVSATPLPAQPVSVPTQVSFTVGTTPQGIVPVLPGSTRVDSRYQVEKVAGELSDVMTTNPYAGTPSYSLRYFRVPTRTWYLTVTDFNTSAHRLLTCEYK